MNALGTWRKWIREADARLLAQGDEDLAALKQWMHELRQEPITPADLALAGFWILVVVALLGAGSQADATRPASQAVSPQVIEVLMRYHT